ncbi:hypothetical protein B484DRAFT_428149 [Ochromonadaceae sp. CCMP2298]|nr:hypothetical protein B484DRAFT_428149 [Ochromonadaceae sp. CCMP2298]
MATPQLVNIGANNFMPPVTGGVGSYERVCEATKRTFAAYQMGQLDTALVTNGELGAYAAFAIQTALQLPGPAGAAGAGGVAGVIATVNATNNAVDALTATVDALTTTVNNTNATVNALTATVNATNNAVHALTTTVTAANNATNNAVHALTVRLGNLEARQSNSLAVTLTDTLAVVTNDAGVAPVGFPPSRQVLNAMSGNAMSVLLGHYNIVPSPNIPSRRRQLRQKFGLSGIGNVD